MMLKQCLLILMLMGVSHIRLYAQSWSEKDSVWLSGVLSGKDTIRINPEFQKAIDSGTFIHLEDEPGQQMLEAPTELPILKDFSEYLHADADTVRDRLIYKSMPPSVYRLIDKKEIQVGKLPVTAAVGGKNLYSSDVVKDGQKRGTVGGSVKLYFSLDDMLKWVFSKKERNKRKNRKRDDTWRYYNSIP